MSSYRRNRALGYRIRGTMSTHQAGGAAADDEAQQKRELEEDEEMPLAERDLADDAPWKRIQQNTFTRWCNEHLKVANKHISKLDTDLSDGLRLIALIEVLAQKKIARFNKRPTFRSMKLENVSIAIKFLEDQSIKIVNIDSSDIVDGKIKLILGLIWLLILHYSISMPMWDEEGMAEDDSKKQSPKDKLLGWIQSKVPDKPIKNFNKDWNDGQAIGALVDAVAPGLCPDWQDWDPKDNLKNAKEAMKLAEDWLDVPQVLRPEDMTNKDVDDLSMMTYLSAFPKAKLKPGAPLRPKSNAKKVRAYGPGLEDGNAISKPTDFTIETFGAGSGKIDVVIMDPKGKPLEHHMKANKDKKQTYTVEYTPKLAGKHVITIKFKDVEIPKSPFTINVANITTDASKCSAKGPGLEPTGLVLNQKTHFEIFTAGAGAATPTVTMTSPDGKQVPIKLQDKGKGVYYVEYTPVMIGVYKIEIKFGGAHIPGSVFSVKIAHALNAGRAFAYGRGLQPKGLRVKEECVFYIDTKEAGEAGLRVRIIGPGGVDEPVKTTYNNDGLYTCKYSPYKPGRYIVNVKYGGQAIPKAPFTVNIGPEPSGPLTQVRAFGPGLEGGIVGKSCDFTVETNGAVGALGFAIEGPSQAEIKCKDNGDGSCEVSYFPTSPGDYAVHVTYEEEDIPCSPFMAKVVPNPGGFDASKVKAFGPGLAADGIEIKKKTEFTVDVKQAGIAKLVIDIRDQWGNKIEAEVKDNKNGTYTVYYTPEHPLKHTVAVTWGGVSIPNSPFKINVGGGMTKVKVYGPGVEPNKVKAKQATEFTIDTKEAGKAPVAVSIKSKAGVNGPKEKEIPVKVKDNNDGTFTANYTPEGPGEYAVSVKYGGTELPQSPIKVGVVPDVDVSKIKITDLQESLDVGKENSFHVDTTKAGDGDLKPTITGPDGKVIPVKVVPVETGFDVKFTPTEEGPHNIDMTYGGFPVLDSVLTLNADPKPDASKVKAEGPGLTGGHVNKPADFTIDIRDAGRGGLSVGVEGPSEAEIDCQDNGDGTCAVFYTPNDIGSYTINITFDNKHITGSPFEAKVIDTNLVKACGPGISNGAFVNFPCTFEVDCSKAGEPPIVYDKENNLPVQCTAVGPTGEVVDAKVEPKDDDVYQVTYFPIEEGPHTLDTKYCGYDIPEFPKDVSVNPPIDFSKIVLEGPGLTDGLDVGRENTLHVNAPSAGKDDLMEATVTGPDGKIVPVKVVPVASGFDLQFTPTKEGPHEIDLKYAGRPILDSALVLNAHPPKPDAARVKAEGPGLTAGHVNEPAEFTIDTRDAGRGGLGVGMEGPSEAEIKSQDNGDGTCTISYTPKTIGTYTINLTFDKEPIPGSPFEAKVIDSNLVKARGPGITNGAFADFPCTFEIDCSEAGEPPLDYDKEDDLPVKCMAVGPRGEIVDVKVEPKDDEVYQVTYSPLEEGPHTLDAIFCGYTIPEFPKKVSVNPPIDISKIVLEGPGLADGLDVGRENTLHVNAPNVGDDDLMEATVTGPDGKIVPVKLVPVESGFDLQFTPTEEGPHLIDLKYAGCPIVDSPLELTANPAKPDASKVKAEGPGLTAGHVNKPAEFTIDTSNAGPGGLNVGMEGPSEAEIDCQDNGDGTCDICYIPKAVGTYGINITFDKEPIPGSPFKAKVIDSTLVDSRGPGLTNGAFMDFPCTFEIDCQKAGEPPIDYDKDDDLPVKCMVVGPEGEILDVTVEPKDDEVYQVTYSPLEEGPHTLDAIYCGYTIPEFPKKVSVNPPIDISKIVLDGPGLTDEVFCECPTDFKVDATQLGQPLDKNLLTTDITTPSKKKIKPTITDNKDNTYTVGYVPVEQGPHTVDVAFAGQPLGNSPYTADAYPGFDASKVKAYGPGLEAGLTKKPAQFTVETKNAGKGGLGIQVEGPAETKMTCKDNKDGTCAVEYFPTVPGDYAVHVTFADEPIPGSPFRPSICDSVDASKVKATGPGLDRNGVRANVPAEFKVDAKQAGKAPLDVTVIQEKGAPEKAKIVDNKDGTYDVTYVPKTEGRCQVDIKYGGQQIPDSPFNTKVLPKSDATKVKVDGPGIQKTGVLASLPVEFTVDTRDAGDAELIISITDSKGKPVKPDIRDNGDGTFTISYVPKDVGQYTVTVTYGGKNVPASPFSIKTSPTGDASKCSIMEETITKTVIVEEETVIKVNSRDAGKGHVTCTITGPDGKEIPDVKVIQNPDGTFDIIWTCPAAGNYEVDLRFGGVSLTGGPITIYAAPGPPEDLIQPDTVQQVEAAMPQDCRPLDLVIPVIGAGSGCITGEVKTPSGRIDTPVILENKDGTITVKYSPRETGQHLLAIKYNGKDVPGSPFHFHVDELKSGNVTAYGTGLTHGISNEPCHFIINTKDAGAGGLSLAIEGPSKAEIKCVDNKDGTCSVTYFPTKPGQYDIVVKFANKHIPGSPFSAQIVDKAGSRMSIGTPSDVPLKITETDLTQLTATILTPSKQEEKCSLKRLPNGNIGITFTPKEIGEHLVSVKKKGNHIPNSPFKIIVGSQEVGDATKVKVTGRGIKECDAGQTAQFVVDTRNAGYGGLGVSIEGPSKADINCEDKGDGTCLVTYKPTEPGTYNVNVHYADQLVPGSPFQVTVKGDSMDLPLIRETLVRPTSATPVSHIGSECELSVKIPGTDPLDMTAQVTNPAGRTEDAEIIDKPDCKYCVKFVPTMDGVHTVSVKNRGMHVPGSPFQFTVGPFGEGGAHKVHAGGPGLERGEVGQPAEFTVWTREAGPGKLGITVSGPAKAPINFTDNKDGSYLVSYVPTMPGDYVVDIKFNDKPIPDSPYKPFITPPMGEARRLSVASLQESGVKANQPCSFVIQLNGAKGHLKARAVSPSGTDVECIITEIDEENYAVRFLPKENGIHLVHVFFKETPIPGSPFRIRVGTVEEVGDPGMVHAYGDGLEKGKTGETCEFIVNTCGAGAGTLAIQIDGPSKVKLDVTEVAEGYKCHYVATQPGDYMISIKYGGPINITGSPFKAKITGAAKGGKAGVQESAQVMVETIVKTTTTTGFQAPVFTSDASKVVSSGMGLKKAFINKKSQFTVNGNDAGNNMLVVGIAGPKTPCEEILVKHNYGQRYTVTYLLKEKGNYVLMVKWGEEHIPGSPFSIQCA